jgi:hypothetical protein
VTAPRDTLRQHLWVALRLCVYAMVAPPLSTHLAARTLLKLRLQQPQLRPGVVHRLAQLRDLVRHAARCRREVIARRGGLQHRDQVVDRLGVVALRDSRARGSSAHCVQDSGRRILGQGGGRRACVRACASPARSQAHADSLQRWRACSAPVRPSRPLRAVPGPVPVVRQNKMCTAPI